MGICLSYNHSSNNSSSNNDDDDNNSNLYTLVVSHQ